PLIARTIGVGVVRAVVGIARTITWIVGSEAILAIAGRGRRTIVVPLRITIELRLVLPRIGPIGALRARRRALRAAVLIGRWTLARRPVRVRGLRGRAIAAGVRLGRRSLLVLWRGSLLVLWRPIPLRALRR